MKNNNETDSEKIYIHKELEPMYRFLRKLDYFANEEKDKQALVRIENDTRQELIRAINIIPLKWLSLFKKNIETIFFQYQSDVKKIITKKK